MTNRTVVGRNVGNPRRRPPHTFLFAMLGWAVPILAVAALFVAVAPHAAQARPLAAADPAVTAEEGDLRLTGGASEGEGVLEYFHDGRWGTVCNNRITSPGNKAPELACKMMGFDGGAYAGSRGATTLTLADQPIWLDDLRCIEGSTHWTGRPPRKLSDCWHAGLGLNNCDHSEDVKVRCTRGAELQLRHPRGSDPSDDPVFTIAAGSDTYGYQIDDVVFTVTRTGTTEEEIGGSVSFTQDDTYLPAASLSWSFTIPANETTVSHTLTWTAFTGGATQTGDLTATLDDGDDYDVGTPGAATVEMVVASPAITVRPEKAAYSFDEDDASASVAFVARTAPDVPRPNAGFDVSVTSFARTDGAQPPDDYANPSTRLRFEPADFTASGSEWEARKEIALALVDDGEDEGDETFDLELEHEVGQQPRIGLRQADGSVCQPIPCTIPVTLSDPREDLVLTIAAASGSYGYQIDDVVFTVTRTGTTEAEIGGSVTMTQDHTYLPAASLSWTFTIPANETTVSHTLSRSDFSSGATQTGDLTATLDDGDDYEVGTPGTATVEMVVADPAITIRPEHAAYSFDEDDDAASVTFIARTAPGVPRPNVNVLFTVTAVARDDGAEWPSDYAPILKTIGFAPADFVASGSEWEAPREVALTLVDDGEAEGDETFDLELEAPPGAPARIKLRQADRSACPDKGCLTPVTIVDNEASELVATHDTATTPVNTALEIPVLENDAYAGGNAHLLGVSKVTGSVHGTTRINEDRNGVVFVPDTGYSGIARFTYSVSDGTLADTAAVIVAVGGDDGSGVGVPIWQARWSTTGGDGCTTFSLGVENTNPDAPVADDELIGVTLHVDRQRSTVDVNAIEVKDASGNILDPKPFSPNIHHDGAWTYIAGTTAGAASTVMTVQVEGTSEPPCDGNLVAWVYVDGWLAGRDHLTAKAAVQQQALARTSPVLRILDAQAVESPGTSLRFPVTLDAPAESVVSVHYRTSDGTAVAGADYEAASGTLIFEPGQTSKTVSVAVLDDALDEGSETFTLAFSNPNPSSVRLVNAEATGTIVNADAMPKAWIARFGRTVADQVLDAAESRMRAARKPGIEVTLAGQRLGGGTPQEDVGAARDSAWQERAGFDSLESRGVTQRDLLGGTSFTTTAEAGRDGYVSLWGRGAVTRFDGREGELTLDGEVASAMVGVDWDREAWTAGLIAARSDAEGGYEGSSGGRVEATLTGLYPWGRLALSDRVDAWGAAGYGTGELAVTPKVPGTDEDGSTIRTDLDLRMAAAGLRGVLVDGGADGLSLAGKTDALIVTTASDAARGPDGGSLAAARARVTRLRLGVEAERPLQLGDGGTLTPSVEIGLRRDGGDAETGFGIDVGGGIAWSLPAHDLELELRGRGLLTHEAEGFRERGFSGSLAWDPAPSSKRGPALTLTQTVGGSATGGADALLARGTLAGLAAQPDSGAGDDDDLQHRRLEARFGYGFPAFGGRFASVPEIGFGLSDTGREYIVGWRLTDEGPGALQLSAEARRHETDGGSRPAEHRIGARLSAQW